MTDDDAQRSMKCEGEATMGYMRLIGERGLSRAEALAAAEIMVHLAIKNCTREQAIYADSLAQRRRDQWEAAQSAVDQRDKN